MTLSEMLFDNPPSGGSLNTVILTVLSPYTPLFCSGPGALKRLGSALETAAAGTLARSVRILTNVVGTGISSTRTTEFPTNPTPLTVISKSGLPSTATYGATALISGSGVLGMIGVSAGFGAP